MERKRVVECDPVRVRIEIQLFRAAALIVRRLPAHFPRTVARSSKLDGIGQAREDEARQAPHSTRTKVRDRACARSVGILTRPSFVCPASCAREGRCCYAAVMACLEVVPVEGVEPPTFALRMRCSTV